MASVAPPRKILQAILSGKYTPLDLREFVQFCYSLALPLIRKKIALGKLNLDAIGLKEPDVVYDCLADLFNRDEQGRFPQIRTFFEDQFESLDAISDEQLLSSLRQLIFGKVNNNIIRLYSEADPALGKILRNLKLALERTQLFEEVSRFGEAYLIPRDVDSLAQLPPMPLDIVRQQFSLVVLIHENVPEMVKKLHRVLTEQDMFQRGIPLVSAALLFKEVYALGWETEEVETGAIEQKMEAADIARTAEGVYNEIRTEMHLSYVGKGKRSEKVFEQYMLALREILLNEFADGEMSGRSYFDYLRLHIPNLTKQAYARKHRTVLEYLAKKAKKRMREELRRGSL